MKNKLFAATLGFALLSPLQADTLLIQAIEEAPPNTSEGLLRPTHGAKMSQVEARFGAPEKVHPTVGEPPITRWDYPSFSVYFEHDIVLDSVVHRSHNQNQ